LKKIQKILIVGGTGFIGYHFTKKCLSKKFEVTSISRNRPKKTRRINKVKYIYCDIANKKKLNLKLNKYYDYVINLGGDVDHHGKNTFKSHFTGCKNLVEILRKKKIKRFIQLSSSVEYGDERSPNVEKKFKKKTKYLKSIYAKAKLSSTLFLLKLYKKARFPVVIFRLFLAYGPKQDYNRIIPFTIKNCLANKKFACSNGEQTRDFIFINDLVEVLFKSLNKNYSIEGQIFNLGTGIPVKIKKIINFIKDKCKKGKPQFGLISLRKDEVKHFYANINKTKKIFKWKPRTKIENGLTETIKYYENCFKKKF